MLCIRLNQFILYYYTTKITDYYMCVLLCESTNWSLTVGYAEPNIDHANLQRFSKFLNKKVCIFCLSNILALIVLYEGYSRNVSCATN